MEGGGKGSRVIGVATVASGQECRLVKIIICKIIKNIFS
jgi:hypothetical protein